MSRESRTNLIVAVLAVLLMTVAIQRLGLFRTDSDLNEQVGRFSDVVKAVDQFYFEEVDSKKLVNDGIRGLLNELDPHSIYISSDHMGEVQEQFDGEFEGIGIEFIIHEKYPLIISAIPDSPSDEVGLKSGDRIIKIENVSTQGITDDEVREKLLGKKGSKVTIQIRRPSLAEPFDVTIVRDKIPIQSVAMAFLLDETTGYIRIGRFAKTTNEEFAEALQRLKLQGMQRLVLDLRGNSGGYLDQAVEVADHFLESNKRIVYTRGRITGANEDYYSSGSGKFANLPLIVLISHGSASASEIVAGAIQDWDRGLILGTTSFGKGLVQHQIPLDDGSAVRVTIARYYTPSGRLIQRSYENGVEEYVAQGYDDVDENAISDSQNVRPVFTTSGGRKVFGGGGITPDIEIKPADLTASTVRLVQSQAFFEIAYNYVNDNPDMKNNFSLFKRNFSISRDLIQRLKEYASQKSVSIDEAELQNDLAFIKRRLKSQIARHLWGSDEYYEVEINEDPQVQQAQKYFSKAARIAQLTLD